MILSASLHKLDVACIYMQHVSHDTTNQWEMTHHDAFTSNSFEADAWMHASSLLSYIINILNCKPGVHGQ